MPSIRASVVDCGGRDARASPRIGDTAVERSKSVLQSENTVR